jgi:hypothetical protein
VYVLGVWATGDAGLRHSRALLPPSQAPAACSSPFAIADYHVAPHLGGDAALASFRASANAHGVRVLLDFVPNHVAADHAWTATAPWRLAQGSAEDAARYPDRYYAVTVPAGLQVRGITGGTAGAGTAGAAPAPAAAPPGAPPAPPATETLWLCHGRDPYNVWRDTVNLNLW